MPPRRQKNRSRPLQDAGSALYGALCGLGLTDQAKRLRIFERWKEAVGPKTAARTCPQMFSRGVLIVKAASPTWQNELMFLKASILVRLNELLGGKKRVVLDLKVISGHVPPPAPPAATWQPQAPRGEDSAAAESIATAIADPEVRAAFVRLRARDLANKRGG